MNINQGAMAWLYIIILALILQLFMPWWSIALAAGIIGAGFTNKGRQAFFSGFAGIGLLWLCVSSYIHFVNDGILSTRVSMMMGLPNAFSIVLVTAFLGALVGGISSLSGFFMKDYLSSSRLKKNVTSN